MRTLGIDLASKPKNTAACVINWHDGEAVVESVETGVTNARIIDLHQKCDATGIDAPFGWPRPFVKMVCAHDSGLPVDLPENLNQLYFRRTDHFVWNKTGKIPLAVGADKIAIPAMRCAALLSDLNVTDRSGDGRVFEVYPAAALRVYGIGVTMPGADPKVILNALMSNLESACPWLDFQMKWRPLLISNRDAFDALVSSVVTRAASLGLIHEPGGDEIDNARIEGWIAVPFHGSLGKLATAN